MKVIAYGRCDQGETCSSITLNGKTLKYRDSCNFKSSAVNFGMCNVYDKVTPANIVVEYRYTGLGYVGRPGGPVPTITVKLAGLQYDFIMVGGLLGASVVQMPSFATTVTGEDLNSVGS